MEGFVIGHFHKVHQVTPFRRIKSGRMPLILQAHQVLKPAIILHFRPQNFTKFIRKIARSVLFGFSAPLVVNGTIRIFCLCGEKRIETWSYNKNDKIAFKKYGDTDASEKFPSNSRPSILPGNWYHFVITVDASSLWMVYVNDFKYDMFFCMQVKTFSIVTGCIS